MAGFSIEWQVTKNHEGVLLRDYLIKEKKISRRALKSIKFNGGRLFVNEAAVTVRYRLQQGDLVHVLFPSEKKSEFMQGTSITLDIVFEDEHLLLVNKPPGLPTIPSKLHTSETLANGILYYYQQKNIPYTVHPVSRLDADTSGLILIAKHRYAHDLLTSQQKQKKIIRQYEALVHGRIEEDEGTIDKPLGRKEGSIIEREVQKNGKQAVTHFTILKRREGKTLLSLQLETGRTHQIRVHLASIGHPLLGDSLYGGIQDQIKRQALHSKKLTFLHPFSEKELTFTASLPEDMLTAMQH